jgi:hypothetical protein
MATADVLGTQEYADMSLPEAFGPDPGSVIQAAACDLLGRRATDDEVRSARQFLTRPAAVSAFLDSPAFRRGLANQVYARLLRRPATADESAASANADLDELAAGLAGSRAYFEHANGGGTLAAATALPRDRVRVTLKRASELRVGLIRNGRRVRTIRLGRHVRGTSVAKWRARGAGVDPFIVEAWSRGRMIDATEPIGPRPGAPSGRFRTRLGHPVRR